MRIFYFKWILLCSVAAHLGIFLVWPVMNHVSFHYGDLYFEPMVGVVTGTVMALALYWVMRDLILSFWTWVVGTALAYGVGAFLGVYVKKGVYTALSREWMMTWGMYLPQGLISGLFIGIWVGAVQCLMLPLLDAKRWVLANIFGYGVGYVLSYSVANWVMDLPHGMHAFVPGFMGICVGGATLYVFLRSEFGELRA